MLNFEKRLKELNKEKAEIEAKKQEICERFDSLIAKKQEDIAKLENYKKDIGNLTKKQIDILSSANELAGSLASEEYDDTPPAEIKEEAQEIPSQSLGNKRVKIKL